jgi:guanylate kinase
LLLADFLTDVMRRKLLRRTQRQKSILSLKDLENIERRATSAFAEPKEAWRFEHVIPNHDGEDSENWDAFYASVELFTAIECLQARCAGSNISEQYVNKE